MANEKKAIPKVKRSTVCRTTPAASTFRRHRGLQTSTPMASSNTKVLQVATFIRRALPTSHSGASRLPMSAMRRA